MKKCMLFINVKLGRKSLDRLIKILLDANGSSKSSASLMVLLSDRRHVLYELHEGIGQCTLFCDNQCTINIAFNPIMYLWTKRIEIDQHFVCQKVEDMEIDLTYICSCDQVAGVTHHQFWFFKHKLYMIKNHASLEEGGCQSIMDRIGSTIHVHGLDIHAHGSGWWHVVNLMYFNVYL